ncbi:hypothetical protein F511_37546 [Dorcoceras hygrometricum]|uniref:Uncharacterized protein n=1 Tax=Dorcoceras hygrometricum TaxID=472368 RepID=A0A2Z7AHJ4_9LAMI|nr:hypothetical protein F511_37546 [Dorcoceras hygrometricum]
MLQQLIASTGSAVDFYDPITLQICLSTASPECSLSTTDSSIACSAVVFFVHSTAHQLFAFLHFEQRLIVHSRITVLCSTADSADVKVADPPVVSTADPDFCCSS